MHTMNDPDLMAAVLDPHVAQTIDDLGAAVAARVWKTTISELPNIAQRIACSLQDGELSEAAAAAHAGKGSAGTVGLLRLSEGLNRLIELARTGDAVAARDHWQRLEPLVALSVTAVAKHLWRA